MVGDPSQPAEDAAHVAVDHRNLLAVRDARDRARRVPPDPLQLHQPVNGAGDDPAVLAPDALRSGVEEARPPVESKPGPVGVDLLVRRRGQVSHGRETPHPFSELVVVRAWLEIFVKKNRFDPKIIFDSIPAISIDVTRDVCVGELTFDPVGYDRLHPRLLEHDLRNCNKT